MEEKLSTIFLRDGRNALQYVMSLSEKYRQIATEAIFECLRLGLFGKSLGNTPAKTVLFLRIV